MLPVSEDENEREITRGKVERVLKEIKPSKAPAMDGVTTDMLMKGV